MFLYPLIRNTSGAVRHDIKHEHSNRHCSANDPRTLLLHKPHGPVSLALATALRLFDGCITNNVGPCGRLRNTLCAIGTADTPSRGVTPDMY